MLNFSQVGQLRVTWQAAPSSLAGFLGVIWTTSVSSTAGAATDRRSGTGGRDGMDGVPTARTCWRCTLLTEYDPVYEAASGLSSIFMWISTLMTPSSKHQDEMWDLADGFFYDLLRPFIGRCRLKVRSLVGLLPRCKASTVFCAWSTLTLQSAKKPDGTIAAFRQRFHPELVS